jgi:hypothetical protein
MASKPRYSAAETQRGNRDKQLDILAGMPPLIALFQCCTLWTALEQSVPFLVSGRRGLACIRNTKCPLSSPGQKAWTHTGPSLRRSLRSNPVGDGVARG